MKLFGNLTSIFGRGTLYNAILIADIPKFNKFFYRVMVLLTFSLIINRPLLLLLKQEFILKESYKINKPEIF